MVELIVKNFDGQEVIDSRDVAGMIGKPHNDLMKTIRSYINYLNEGDFSHVDFFAESTYTDGKGENRPCYLLTKKGCDMVANKLTGEKGVLFTAAYVTAFEKMREHIEREFVPSKYQEMVAETQRKNVSLETARLLNQIAEGYEGDYKQVLQAYVTKELVGDFVLPLPALKEKTYSAGEIGKLLGISGNKVGRLTTKHNLKTEEYGQWFHDKASGSNKEIQSFRYYEKVVPVLKELLKNA